MRQVFQRQTLTVNISLDNIHFFFASVFLQLEFAGLDNEINPFH